MNRYTLTVIDPKNETLRKSFNALIKETFGFDFEKWYQDGHWPSTYLPHVLVEDERVVANISVNLQVMNTAGDVNQFAQLGAVATKESHRKKGLSRYLMKIVLEKYRPICDQIYLYANQEVVDFYPKFGFVMTTEIQYYLENPVGGPSTSMRTLDLSCSADLALLREKAALGNPYSAFSMENGASLILFYATYFMEKNVFYLPEFDLIIVGQMPNRLNRKLVLTEVLGKKNIELNELITYLTPKKTKEAILGFTPKNKHDFKSHPFKEIDSSLFILNPEMDITKKINCMFPLLTHT